MGAVEDVFVPAAAGDRRDLTAVEAHAHVAEELGLRGRRWFPDGAAEMKP